MAGVGGITKAAVRQKGGLRTLTYIHNSDNDTWFKRLEMYDIYKSFSICLYAYTLSLNTHNCLLRTNGNLSSI